MRHDGDESSKNMTIVLEIGGETQRKSVPLGGTVSDLYAEGHFGSLTFDSLLVNGGSVTGDDILEDGDVVSQIPKSGKQG